MLSCTEISFIIFFFQFWEIWSQTRVSFYTTQSSYLLKTWKKSNFDMFYKNYCWAVICYLICMTNVSYERGIIVLSFPDISFVILLFICKRFEIKSGFPFFYLTHTIYTEYEEFRCKNKSINFYQFEILVIKLLKYKETYKKVWLSFGHDFKDTHWYVMSKVSGKSSYLYYTGWPRKNATLTINDIKKTRINKLCLLLRIKLFFQQDDTKIVEFDEGVWILRLFFWGNVIFKICHFCLKSHLWRTKNVHCLAPPGKVFALAL